MKTNGKNVSFEFGGISLLLSSTDKCTWRLQSARNAEFEFCGAAQTLAVDLNEDTEFKKLDIDATEKDGVIEVYASDGSSVVCDGKKITFFDPSKEHKKVITSIKSEQDRITATVRLERNIRVYGTGERFNKVNQRGKKVHIYAIDKWCRKNGNSYCPIPFVMCSDCTALFLNRFERSKISMGSNLKLEQRFAPLDLYVFVGETPADILQNYSRLTGFAPMPPQWSFGTLVCRYHPEFETVNGVMAMSDNMKKADFPWDAIILEGFRPYNKKNWSDLEEISTRLHADGKKVMLYEQCGRYPKNADETFGLTDQYAVKGPNGAVLHETRSMNFVDNFQNKKMTCIDLTSPESVEKWTQMWDNYVVNMDIDGAKIDFCEQFPDNADLTFADGRETPGMHHLYPVLYNTMQFKHFNTKPDGGVCFSRGGGIGAQRYPFLWAGDQMREFRFLPYVIRATLSLGFSGVPFVSWDMAGYMPAINPIDKKREKDIFIRGIEFTAFSGCIQTHGKVTRPYDFDEHTKDIYRAYSKLHNAIRPYITEQASVSCSTGLPLMRHLYLYDSKDKRCLDIEDEYMLGSSLLVAPILGKKNVRDIYLPKGKWINIFTGEKFNGKQIFKNMVVAPESIPVFMLADTDSEVLVATLNRAKPLLDEINSLIFNGD